MLLHLNIVQCHIHDYVYITNQLMYCYADVIVLYLPHLPF